MIAANMYKSRPKIRGSRGPKGLWLLALAGISLAIVMGLLMASADQTPYGATQVWSAEPTGGRYTTTPSVIGSPVIGGNAYGQDAGSIPASTHIYVGAR